MLVTSSSGWVMHHTTAVEWSLKWTLYESKRIILNAAILFHAHEIDFRLLLNHLTWAYFKMQKVVSFVASFHRIAKCAGWERDVTCGNAIFVSEKTSLLYFLILNPTCFDCFSYIALPLRSIDDKITTSEFSAMKAWLIANEDQKVQMTLAEAVPGRKGRSQIEVSWASSPAFHTVPFVLVLLIFYVRSLHSIFFAFIDSKC